MSFNTRCPAVKRLLKEAQELSQSAELFYAQPLEDNLFEWHFTIRGPPESDFQGGIYHGRILLPAEYPMKPPSIILLTPNGRFKVNEKICLSISGHHPETWLPSWSIRTALLALIGFMPTMGEGAIGSLDYSCEERKDLALKSINFKCSVCNVSNSEILPELTDKSNEDCAEARELASQIQFKNSKPSEEQKSQPELTRRNVASSSSENSSANLQTNVPPVDNRIQTSTTQANNSTTLTIMIVLSGLFIFLLLRRIYLIVDRDPFSV
ncbi:ubiquitin-conjugating enzyme E2 J1 isoform X2 [Brachionus plicatilis]|uniref:Ubiquitin-conjugating enzyme E2 J1 isoform X2 n=1 Tax=Brachionus plicatilis TaxID=10195 RepID=A0A3M7T3V4_BRAPC|nr:ubiquitin-conjugating enzyme E2 J1 isoform X2 [Brachionus plicatilis]